MINESPYEWCCVAAVNKPEVLKENLAASPALEKEPHKLHVFENETSAGVAYNKGIDETKSRIIVFAHQDVYLPKGWECTLEKRIHELDKMDPRWAVAGLMGITKKNGNHFGRVWSTGLGVELGTKFTTAVPATSFDELLLILNRDSGLRFDLDLPSFHLYGTDLAQTALATGHTAYIIHAPVIHNSQPVKSLQGGFYDSYKYIKNKWHTSLPLTTLVTEITATDRSLKQTQRRLRQKHWRQKLKLILNIFKLRNATINRISPKTIAIDLGYERD